MPATQSRQSPTRRARVKRQQPQPGRLDGLRRLPMPAIAKRGRRAQQNSGLMTTLTSAATSLRGTGKSRRAKQRGGRKAPLLALMSAGAGAAAFAKRRAGQREATPPESPPDAPPQAEPPQAA